MDATSAADRLASGHRQFYTLPKIPDLSSVDSAIYRILSNNTRSSISEGQNEADNRGFENNEDFFDYINRSVIGYNKVFTSVFGDRRVIYCDYIASGRSLSFIEDFIYNEVLPDYGNTHTMTSVTSLQTTMYRHEAKDIVRNAVRASDYDAVFFVGSGCTGAVHKLIHNLHLEKPPIVITGPFEHHSNILPWRHMAAKIVRLNTDKCGNVSIHHLEEALSTERRRANELGCSLIVCLAAASNVTGILVDVDKFSALVHRYGGLVFWDYATAAPYVKIDMNPVVSGPNHGLVYKDAVYFSMHKFVGGVQTPGVLIAKRILFKAGERHPDGCGGGSVCFVRRDHQVYLKDVEEREEGGTPAIVESIRAGLVMQLKEAVTPEVIVTREEAIVKRAWVRFKSSPNLLVLGGDKAPRLPIFSVVVRHVFPDVSMAGGQQELMPCDRPMFLHHTFVAALLNDLFGIQCRAGCVCAGPYAMDLLGIDEPLAKLYEDALVTSEVSVCRVQKTYDKASSEVLRPGFTRFSIPYFMSDEEANFVLEAVCFVADYGWAFLPLYSYDAMTGEWKHRQHDQLEDRQWLGHIKYTKEGMTWRRAKIKARGALPKSLQECLMAAKVELKRAVDFVKSAEVSPVPDVTANFDAIGQKLRWFVLPCEAAAQMRGEISQLAISTGPSSPWKPGTMDPCTNAPAFTTSQKSLASHRRSAATTSPIDHQATPSSSHAAHHRSPVGSASPRHRNRRPHSSSPQHLFSLARPMSPNFSTLHNEPKSHAKYKNNVQQENNSHINCESTVQVINQRPRSTPCDSTAGRLDSEDPGESKLVLREFKGLYDPSSMTRGSGEANLRVNRWEERTLWRRPFKQLYRPFVKAIKDFDMIHRADRILVCLSGGKDSLSLLHCMHAYQEVCLRRPDYPSFEIGAVTVDPGSLAFDPRPLIPYLAGLGVKYFYEEQNIMAKASQLGNQCSSICRIYAVALRHGYNVIALGQHLDDLAESFLMSCFHNGAMNTMKAHYTVRAINLRVIRPFVYIRERVTRAFAERAGLPIIPENCPACFQMPKERMRAKRVLSDYENIFPSLFSSLQAAMLPLIARDAALGLSAFEDAEKAIASKARETSVNSDFYEGQPLSCPRLITK